MFLNLLDLFFSDKQTNFTHNCFSVLLIVRPCFQSEAEILSPFDCFQLLHSVQFSQCYFFFLSIFKWMMNEISFSSSPIQLCRRLPASPWWQKELQRALLSPGILETLNPSPIISYRCAADTQQCMSSAFAHYLFTYVSETPTLRCLKLWIFIPT